MFDFPDDAQGLTAINEFLHTGSAFQHAHQYLSLVNHRAVANLKNELIG